MASLVTGTLRARLATHSLQRRVVARGFSSTPSQWAAHNFLMPAMSPTMTEGNVASWKVKEGDSFSAGDILLEIETDKAQMDIEAQDDGKVAKIMAQDGSKSVQVGTRIAVLADPEDDIQTLEIPAEDTSSQSSKPESSQSDQPSEKQQPQQESNPSKTSDTSKPQAQPSADAPPTPRNQEYPLYPSVEHLLHTNGIPEEEASQIPATGPAGRLLKGDVLAYIGSIEKSYAEDLSKRLSKLSHLDLSNIKIAAPKQPAKEEAKKETKATTPAPETEIAIPISLAAVFRLQNKIHDSLGLDLPLSTIIARASELANENLPKAAGASPNTDDLFDEVLGLKDPHIPRASRGHYIPRITALPPPAPLVFGPPLSGKKPDIIDLLAASKPTAKPIPAVPAPLGAVPGGAGANNVFSLSVKRGEEKRARVYLERVKSVLEAEPGRCVL